jgi:hypothetical protein
MQASSEMDLSCEGPGTIAAVNPASIYPKSKISSGLNPFLITRIWPQLVYSGCVMSS